MSKRLAGFFGQKCIYHKLSAQPKPQEYTVLGVNQPLIPPESELQALTEAKSSALPKSSKPRKFRFFRFLHRLL